MSNNLVRNFTYNNLSCRTKSQIGEKHAQYLQEIIVSFCGHFFVENENKDNINTSYVINIVTIKTRDLSFYLVFVYRLNIFYFIANLLYKRYINSFLQKCNLTNMFVIYFPRFYLIRIKKLKQCNFINAYEIIFPNI